MRRKQALASGAPSAKFLAAKKGASLGFMHEQLVEDRRLGILFVAYDCPQECLALAADTSIADLRRQRMDDPEYMRATPVA